jgi:hypothetical protein
MCEQTCMGSKRNSQGTEQFIIFDSVFTTEKIVQKPISNSIHKKIKQHVN